MGMTRRARVFGLAKGMILALSLHAFQATAGDGSPKLSALGAEATVNGKLLTGLTVRGCAKNHLIFPKQKISLSGQASANALSALLKKDRDVVTQIAEAHRAAQIDCASAGKAERANGHRDWAMKLENSSVVRALGGDVRFDGKSIKDLTIKGCRPPYQTLERHFDEKITLKGRINKDSVRFALLTDPELADRAWKAHMAAAEECKLANEINEYQFHMDWANYIKRVSKRKWQVSCSDYLPKADSANCRTSLNRALKNIGCGADLVKGCILDAGTDRKICQIDTAQVSCKKMTSLICPKGYVQRNISWPGRDVLSLCQIYNEATRKNIEKYQDRAVAPGSQPADK